MGDASDRKSGANWISQVRAARCGSADLRIASSARLGAASRSRRDSRNASRLARVQVPETSTSSSRKPNANRSSEGRMISPSARLLGL